MVLEKGPNVHFSLGAPARAMLIKAAILVANIEGQPHILELELLNGALVACA
jgi:hypothetical protein